MQTNAHGVKFSLRPKMSWQIWWTTPKGLIETEHHHHLIAEHLSAPRASMLAIAYLKS